jgi:hypothetical protein
VDTIQVQREIAAPVGRVLAICGSRPKRPTKITPNDVIIEPHVAFAQAMIGHYYVPTLPYLAKAFTWLGWLPQAPAAKFPTSSTTATATSGK